MRLKNDVLSVTVDALGAELKSIKKNDIEYLWQGNPVYWKRSSPVLFPIVGRLLDNEYIYDGEIYTMTQHGFARDNIFEVISTNDTSCSLLLEENNATMKKYPFKFNLYISYELKDNELIVNWKVKNSDNKDIYFQIGAHPAFNFLNDSVIDINKVTNKYELKGTPYVNDVVPNIDVKSIIVNDQTFLDDALIFDKINQVTLRDKKKSVTIECDDFPFMGLWSTVKENKNAPFICLEPWHGITDCTFHNKNLREKKGINVLAPSEIFEATYKIIIK